MYLGLASGSGHLRILPQVNRNRVVFTLFLIFLAFHHRSGRKPLINRRLQMQRYLSTAGTTLEKPSATDESKSPMLKGATVSNPPGGDTSTLSLLLIRHLDAIGVGKAPKPLKALGFHSGSRRRISASHSASLIALSRYCSAALSLRAFSSSSL